MKPSIHKILPLGLGIFAALPALAIEPPKDDAPPPPSVNTDSAATPSPARRPAEPPAKSAEAFIGLISADVPEVLAAHLDTKRGEGVVIRDLVPGGPADKAGLTRYDVITRVAGESVGSPAELSQRIAAKKPGQEIAIDLIHGGKSSVKKVVLGTRPASASQPESMRLPGHPELDNVPEGRADRLRDMIEDRLKNFARGPQEMPEMEQDDRGNIQFKSDATFRLMDNDGSVEMRSSDGSKEITVRDHKNKVTWSGPWNNEKDKSAAPAEVRERIERFKLDDATRSGGGFRFRMGPQTPKDEE